jgi:3-phosphoshikimate 1-carboxyvinyltransferase
MQISLSKSELSGRVCAPASKSYTIRALFCAAQAPGKSEIVFPLEAGDTAAAREVLGQVGVSFRSLSDHWQVKSGRLHYPESDLFCRESAATFRFMTALCCLIPGPNRLVPGATLAQRPVKALLSALSQLGGDVCYNEQDASVTVRGGRLRGGLVSLPGNISSQFISALLLVAPRADSPVTIRLSLPAESRAYLLMTLDTLSRFGIAIDHSLNLNEFVINPQPYRPTTYTVEGDWSSAAFLLAAGALCGEVTVANLNKDSLQGDKIILTLLGEMGALVSSHEDGSVTIGQAPLSGIEADLNECIDLLPVMSVLAAAAKGKSLFHGIARARLKESNRILAIKEGLTRLGIEVVEEADTIGITGGPIRGAAIDPRQDHRIAMAFAVLGTRMDDLVIDCGECVTKTFPDFWEVLASLGGRLKRDER